MDKIILALKLQHEVIRLLRQGMNVIQLEPSEATENLNWAEQVFLDALVECGRLQNVE
jgi:hypothetical protein